MTSVLVGSTSSSAGEVFLAADVHAICSSAMASSVVRISLEMEMAQDWG